MPDTSKKSVLFIMSKLGGGGAERVFIDLMRHIDTTRYDFNILLMGKGGLLYPEFRQLVRDRHLKVRYFRSFTARTVNLVLRRLHLPSLADRIDHRRLMRMFAKRRYDTIVSFQHLDTAVLHSKILDKAVKNISWIHNDLKVEKLAEELHGGAEKLMEFYSGVDPIIIVSNDARRAFEDEYGFGDKTETIYNIIDKPRILNRADEREEKKRKFTIVHLGRSSVQKNHPRLIETLAKFKAMGADFELWLAGEGNPESFKTMAISAGIDENVVYYGFQPNPYPILKQGDVFLLTSDYEALPTVIIESLVLGVPVVSTKTSGAKELLASGGGILTGFDSTDLAEALWGLYSDPQERARLSSEAGSQAARFDKDSVLEQIYRIL